MKIARVLQKTLLTAAALAVPALLGAGAALAQSAKDGWRPYESESGSFTVLMPPQQEEKSTTMRISDKVVLYTTELSAVIDSRPFKNVIKRYIVKSDQTFGAPLAENEIQDILEREVETYSAYYKSMGGELRDQKAGTILGFPGREILISFNDPEFGPQGLRALFLMSNVTKAQQVVIGPEETMHAYRTRDFFDSLRLNEGYTRIEGTVSEDWVQHASPMQIFTVALPPVVSPFVPAEPTAQQDGKSEIVSHSIYDPVWNQHIFYNVYGYQFDKSLTYTDVQQVMTRNHIARYGIDMRKVKFVKGQLGESAVLETDIVVPPLEQIPYGNYVQMRAIFLGNYMAIQEILSSYTIGRGELANSLMKTIDFHPQRARDAALATAPAEAAPAATETPPAEAPSAQ
jgi:hypothetical protein